MAEEQEVQLPQLECELRDLDPETTPKTVGDLYELKCSGMLETALSENTKAEFEEGMLYALHIVDITKTETSEFVAQVTAICRTLMKTKSFFL